MPTIRAAVCHAHAEPLLVEEVQLAPPGPGEVRVRMEAVAICASDISYADGGWGGTLPAVFGHEGVGRVVEAGDGVRGFAPGARVLVTLIRSCHACPSCAAGRPAYCEEGLHRDGPLSTLQGTPIVQAMQCGAFAEEVVVDTSQLVEIPEEMPAASACLLSCGVITGVGAAVNAAALRPGQTAVIVGAGGVGLNAIQGARLAGCARVVAMDVSEEKLADARAFGATDTILATEDKPWRRLAEIAPRMADAVLVCTGALPAFRTAPRLLGRGGRVVMVGMPHSGQTVDYEPVILAALGQGVTGSKMGDTVLARDIPWLVDLYAQGRLELDALVSRRWALDEINDAIADTKAGRARRNVLVF
ncbi:zinc-binding dehydrogenase [Rhodovulum sp. 12E13]|uniref:alcohol dehydrogenase catalytic domain-containing protein n=1 Tax=Rhodovulum sp. 12E13 TaxID=2203891 RepID=UPI000E14A486|nr:zinc-binding dehydrogenase [Rhodovulum sp. 12E13]RDC72360.1 zinc-binding dehydrogenase [Rhodovulum sp. 12E13]